MNDATSHLPGIEASEVVARQLKMHVLTSGPERGEPVLLLHGNFCSSTIWEETMLALPERFRAVAPDLRGYGQTDPQAVVDATRGVAQWSDDALALADHFGWDRFHVVAHSMGGCATWALLANYPERLASVTLQSPGPPCGFGGARGDEGTLNHPDGAGSGAGLVNPRLAQGIADGEREIVDRFLSPLAAMRRLYWKPPFRPTREQQLLTAMLQIHQGENHFPGDHHPSPHWPGFAPGKFGPINAMSPLYNQSILPRIGDSPHRPRLSWIYGEADSIICNGSYSDAGMQGKLGQRPDWPGDEVFPPQPLLSQVRFALDRYAARGGTVQRLIMEDVGHTPCQERPEEFQTVLIANLMGE